jgi:hypothetical protein
LRWNKITVWRRGMLRGIYLCVEGKWLLFYIIVWNTKANRYKYHGIMEWMARSMVIEWDLVNQWLSCLLRHGEREGKFGRLKKMSLNWEKGNCGRKLYEQEKTENISWSVIEWTRFPLIFMQSSLLHCATNIFVFLSSPCIGQLPIFVQMDWIATAELLLLLSTKATKAK